MSPSDRTPHARLPEWLRAQRMQPGAGREMRRLLRSAALSTVCEEARCPNQGACFGRGTATFLILGDRCTRACRFCNVTSGTPAAPDPDEPGRVAEAAATLELEHVVITSVTRDDLEDGGAAHFAAVIRALRDALPRAAVEVLVPDFQGNTAAVDAVLEARPDVFNHNVETIARLYPRVRPSADLERSLALLAHARVRGAALVKSGLMVGLGENDDEVEALLRQLATAGVEVVTIGQYLQPRLPCLPVERYVEPQVFDRYREAGLACGLREVFAAPLVRSSFRAAELHSKVTGAEAAR